MSDFKSSPKRAKFFTAVVSVGGQEFSFKLFTRELDFGLDRPVQYYWMDLTEFRSKRINRPDSNFNNCVGLWNTVVASQGLDCDGEEFVLEQANFVLARCFPHVCSTKTLQKIFRDAILSPFRSKAVKTSLPSETTERIALIAKSRDIGQVQRELNEVLGGPEFSQQCPPNLQEGFRRLVSNGVVAVRKDGEVGLAKYLEDVAAELKKYRKKGGQPEVRALINFFAAATKASFYNCYDAAWIHLIPWLIENRSLDPTSEQFLRFWHHQNHCLGPNETDVLSGHILALHPLSGFIMQDPGLRSVVGKFLASESAQGLNGTNTMATRNEYWDFVGVILSAANLYRIYADQTANRGVRGHARSVPEAARYQNQDVSFSTLLEDFAIKRGICCPKCGNRVVCKDHTSDVDTETCVVKYFCQPCRHPVPATFSREDMEDHFLVVE